MYVCVYPHAPSLKWGLLTLEKDTFDFLSGGQGASYSFKAASFKRLRSDVVMCNHSREILKLINYDTAFNLTGFSFFFFPFLLFWSFASEDAQKRTRKCKKVSKSVFFFFFFFSYISHLGTTFFLMQFKMGDLMHHIRDIS